MLFSIITVAWCELLCVYSIGAFILALNDVSLIPKAALCTALVFLAKASLSVHDNIVQYKSMAQMCHALKCKLLNKYIYAPSHEKFIRKEPSYYIQIINNDVDNIFYWGLTYILNGACEGLIFILLYGFVFYKYPLYGAIAAALMFAAFIFAHKILRPIIKKHGSDLQEANESALFDLTEIFNSFTSIVMFRLGKRFIDEYSFSSHRAAIKQATIFIIKDCPRPILEAVFVMVFMGIMLVMNTNNKITYEALAQLTALIYIGLRMTSSLARIISAANSFHAVTASIDRVYEELTYEGCKYE